MLGLIKLFFRIKTIALRRHLQFCIFLMNYNEWKEVYQFISQPFFGFVVKIKIAVCRRCLLFLCHYICRMENLVISFLLEVRFKLRIKLYIFGRPHFGIMWFYLSGKTWKFILVLMAHVMTQCLFALPWTKIISMFWCNINAQKLFSENPY